MYRRPCNLLIYAAALLVSAIVLPKSAAKTGNKSITIGYSWGWTNIGDAAIGPGLLNLLSQRFPDYNLQALAYGNGKAQRIAANIQRVVPDCAVIDGDHLQDAFRDAYAQTVREHDGVPPSPGSNNMEYVFETVAQRCLDFLEERYPETYRAFSTTDLFIYNSGCVLVYGEGTLGGTDFWRYSLARSLPLLMARKLGIPYGIYSHSFDSFGDDPGYSFFKKLLEDAAFVFCRDTDSLHYLLSRSIKPPHLQFVPDSTFSCHWKDRAWADAFMAENQLSPRRFIAIVIRTPAQKSARPQISTARAEDHMKKICSVAESWARHPQMKVLLCPEVSREIEPAKVQVYDRLPSSTQEKTVCMDSFWTHDQAKAVYAKAAMVVSMELHSILLALPDCTPIIHLPFAEVGRKSQFVADMGLGAYLMDIDRTPTAAILERVDYVRRHRQEVSQMLSHAVVPYGRNLEEGAMKVVGSVVEAPRTRQSPASQ